MRAALRAAYRAFLEELQQLHLQQEAKPALCRLICCEATKDERQSSPRFGLINHTGCSGERGNTWTCAWLAEGVEGQ